MKQYIYILCVILLTSCQMKTAAPGIEEALSRAGDNRGELLRVLQHYEESGDSLKLRAAEFLIGNMADKGYFTGRGIDEWVLPYRVEARFQRRLLYSKSVKKLDSGVQFFDTFLFVKKRYHSVG